MAESILKRVGKGDSSAMTECIDRYGPLVWTLVKRRGLNQPDSEDLVQEIFVELWKTAYRFDAAVGSEPTFIAMITRRRLIDRIRRLGRVADCSTLDAAGDVPAKPHCELADIADEAARAREMMKQLRDDERLVLELAIDNGLTQSQIAERTQLPLGTVKTNARRGLNRLRRLLQGGSALKGGA